MPRVAAAEPVGRRVVVRRAVLRPDDRPRYADVVGVLVDAGPAALSVRRRDGTVVEVPRAEVRVLKVVPAAPADVLALEEVAALGWPAPHTRRLGRWLLRAAEGWTGRANSVLPLGDPGLPLDDALAEVTAWYAGHGLPGRLAIPLPGREALDAALARRGWSAYNHTQVLTADVGVTLRSLPERADLPPVEIEPVPGDDWVAAYHYRGDSGLPPVGRAILTGSERPGFAVVRSGRSGGSGGSASPALAIARASLDRGWMGVTAVEVDPAHRRRGLASHVMRALLGWAAESGAPDVYLQVADENEAALALYDRIGFAPHHRYHYRLAPAQPSRRS
jgi:ribosomal protein S18 acetylase RimI-like enzyme